MTEFADISTENLKKRLNNHSTVIIDIRSVDAYNGWKLRDEKRSGHISGARSLPYKWSKYIDWIEIVRNKQIKPEDSLVIYGYESDKSLEIAALFNKAGYANIETYNGFVDEWSANPELPMEKLTNYRQLVSPQWLNKLIRGQNPPEYLGKKFMVCHAHYQNPEDYKKGHIPGAIAMDTNWLESQETWNRRSPEELEEVLTKSGIDCDTTVILYGRFNFPKNEDPFPGSSAGHLGAIRAAFIMMYAGVKDVRILNGGVQSWLDEGFKLSTESVQPQPAGNFGTKIPGNPQIIVDIDEAKEILQSSNANLVSIRSWAEFIGEVSGYNYIEKKGRIPGAVFGNCGTDAYHMENYRNLDHTMKEFHETEKAWKEAGITPDKRNAFYCGTGWRGSEAFWNAWLMGWENAAVFDGGWFEWSSDPNNPYETGIPKDEKVSSLTE